MKIAIDISLLGAIYTGQHFYITSLLNEMISQHPDDEFVLLTYADKGRKEFSGFSNVEFIKLTGGKYSRGKRIIAQQTKMKRVIKRLLPAVFFSPAFTQPVNIRGVKTVVTVHDLIYREYSSTYSNRKNLYLDLIIKNALKNSDHVIAISENTKKDLIKHFSVEAGKVEVIYYGVDEIFREAVNAEHAEKNLSVYNLPENFYFYIGTLEPRKNIPYVIKNFDMFLEEYPDNHLIIWGWKGVLPRDVFAALDRSPHKEKIHFKGYIDHSLIPSVMSLARGMFFVSLYEGFGLPAVEAMAAGCPLFISDLSSLPEVAGDGGIYVDTKDNGGLFEKLIWAKKNPEEVQKAISIGRQRSKNFSWSKAAAETYRLFKW